jgi:endonuclease YncB( thermonuclease family)
MNSSEFVKQKWRAFYPWLKVLGLVGGTVLVLEYTKSERRYEVTGWARLIDGDSLYVDGLEIRLKNIDAPEGRQICRRKGRNWLCGEEATRRLRNSINNREITCKGRNYDRHNRLLAFCVVAGRELNRWMVLKGWAVSFGDYRREEQKARQAGRGIWSSHFQRPRAWRAERR